MLLTAKPPPQPSSEICSMFKYVYLYVGVYVHVSAVPTEATRGNQIPRELELTVCEPREVAGN